MLIKEKLKEKNMSMYRLSKESGVPQATINDICSGKADMEKCAVGTLYRLAKVLNASIEDILESSREGYRSSFETFKSNTCHHVKDMGDIDFMIGTVNDPEESLLLTLRYLNYKTWEEIADELDCSVRKVHIVHSKALSDVIIPAE